MDPVSESAGAAEKGTASLKPKRPVEPDAQQTRVMQLIVCLKGNLTPWWLFSTAFVMYFLCTLGLPHVGKDGAVMDTHIPMAFMFVCVCSWNLFHTPGHGDFYKRMHKILGWTAMVVGFFSVATGYTYILDGESQADLGTKILMLTIGLIQLVLQALGIWYVKGYKWVHMHSSMMTYLFYMSGVLIAINWLPKMVTGHALHGTAATNWMFVSMLSALYIARVAVQHNKKKALEAGGYS